MNLQAGSCQLEFVSSINEIFFLLQQSKELGEEKHLFSKCNIGAANETSTSLHFKGENGFWDGTDESICHSQFLETLNLPYHSGFACIPTLLGFHWMDHQWEHMWIRQIWAEKEFTSWFMEVSLHSNTCNLFRLRMIQVKQFASVVLQVDYGWPWLWHANILRSHTITRLKWSFRKQEGCAFKFYYISYYVLREGWLFSEWVIF